MSQVSPTVIIVCNKSCNTLQRTAAHCNTLQHPTTPYSTLQFTATPCISASNWQHISKVSSTVIVFSKFCGELTFDDIVLQYVAVSCSVLQCVQVPV